MENKCNDMERKVKAWIKKNKALMTVSMIAGFLLSPFIWPFLLAAVYTAISLALPVFLILLGIKMPWKAEKKAGKEAGQGEKQQEEQKNDRREKEDVYEQRQDAFSQGEDLQDGEIPESEQKEKNACGGKTGHHEDRQHGNGQQEAAMSWYAQEGKARILNLMKLAEQEGAAGISIRRDGICSAKRGGNYYRIGALRSFPGDYMELIAGMLKRDVRLPYVKVKGRYLYVFWNKGKEGCA